MKIETKFEYGQEVFYMKNNIVQTGRITDLKITFTYSGYSGGWNSQAYPMQEFYAFETGSGGELNWIHVSKIYATKEELKASL